MGTDTRAGAFLVGAALAVAWSRRSRWLRTVEILGGRATVTVTLAVLAVGSWVFDHRVSRLMFTGTWVAVSVAAGLLVIAYLGNERARHAGIVESPLATYVGRRSYALYLWHYVWLTWLASLGLLGIPLALGASFATAEISWRLVEEPALSLKRRFSSIATALPNSVPAEPATGPAVGTAAPAIGAVKIPA